MKRGEDSRERPSTIIARTEAETPRELGTTGREEERERGKKEWGGEGRRGENRGKDRGKE